MVARIFFPISFVLAVYFRMIFVVEAFVDVIGHTLGFHGLMISLSLVAVQNYWYNRATSTLPCASKVAKLYVVLLLVITGVKMLLAWSVFLHIPIVNPHSSAGAIVGQTFDTLWMIFAAIIPLLVAIKQRNQSRKFKIVLGN